MGKKGILLPSTNYLRIQTATFGGRWGTWKLFAGVESRSPPTSSHNKVGNTYFSRFRHPLLTLQSTSRQPWLVTMEIDNQPLTYIYTYTMEIDTGASLSLVLHTYKINACGLWRSSKSHIWRCAHTYSGEPIVVMGSLEVKVPHQDQDATLTLTMVEGDGPSLLGRDWLQHIRLDWSLVHSVSISPQESMTVCNWSKESTVPARARCTQGVQSQNPCRFNGDTKVLQGTPSSLCYAQKVE